MTGPTAEQLGWHITIEQRANGEWIMIHPSGEWYPIREDELDDRRKEIARRNAFEDEFRTCRTKKL